MSSVEEMFLSLSKNHVKYLLIGGLVSIIYGVPRTTVDIDIAIEPSPRNIQKTVKALSQLGLVAESERVDEILGLGGTTFVNDLQIDVLTDLKGTSFSKLWGNRKSVIYKQIRIAVVGLEDHVGMLKRMGRPQDLEDLSQLRKLHHRI